MEKINKKTEETKESEMNEKEVREDAKKAALEKVKQKIAVVNVNELVEAEAHKAADAYMTESAKNLGPKESTKKTKIGRMTETIKNQFGTKEGLKNTVNKIWKHTIAGEYYRQKEMVRVRKEIEGNDNIYAGRINNDKSFHDGAMKSISERFISDYEGTLSNGEEKKILNSTDKESKETVNAIKDLIIKYANGSLTDEAFASEKVRVLNNLRNEKLLSGSKNYADNLFEIAQNARLAIEHGAKIEELELNTDIIVGKAKSSLKTEAHFNMVDKVVDKLKKSTVGRFVNPATMSLAIGIAYSASVGIGKKVMSSKLASWGTFGASVAASTLLMGANESHRVAEERKQHGLEMAEGGTFEEGDKRREEMNEYQYAMESSTDLENSLRGMMFEKDANGNEIPKDLKQEDIDSILSNLANIEARTQLNSKDKIDLISYSNIGSVEKERTDLTILVAQTKVELRKKIEGEFAGNFNGKKFDELLEEKSKVIEDALLGGEAGIDAKDKAFSKYKTKRVASKMIETAFSGLVVGATVQEVASWFNVNVQGNIESLLGKNNNATIQTPLEHLRSWMMGNHSHVGMENAFPFNINGHEFKLPEGTEIINNSDGTFNILRGGNVISEHIKLGFDSSGALDHESVALLGKDGIMATTDCHEIYAEHTTKVSAEKYINEHKEMFKNISHDGWYDNNTPKPVFDQNEIKLQWGGTNGVDAKGNYVLDISHMTSDGSYHNGFSVDVPEEVKNGGVKMVMSLTQGTQNYVFEAPVDANGHIIIDPKSDEGLLFFKNNNGHVEFKGKFAEIVQSFGEKNGVEHVKTLSTLVGDGNDSITSQIWEPDSTTVNNLDMPLNTKIEMPYFIPIIGRTPLEKVSYKEKEEEPLQYYLNYNGLETTEEEEKYFESVRSQTLKENPSAKLDHYKEIEQYFGKFDKNYLERINRLAKQIDPMGKECKVSINIPVAGHQEANNIYESLENYTRQTADTKNFELVLFVNHPETDKKGNKLDAKNVLDEIARFKKDYPNIKTEVIYEVLTNKEANIGLIRKLMNDTTLLRHHERGASAEDLIMISNDADNKGIDPRYVEAFMESFKKNPDVDGFLGQLDWDPESYQKFPDIHIGTRLFQYLNVIGRHNTNRMTSSGANSAFKASIYAAIGGYRDNIAGGEDAAIRKAIVSARGVNESFAFAGTKSRLFTSSRRAIVMLKQFGIAPLDQWRKGFSVQGDEEIRKLIMEDGPQINYDDKETLDKLKKSLEYVINETLDQYEIGEKLGKDARYYKKALGWLGIKYTLDKNKNVSIIDMTNLVDGLKRYQVEGKLMRDARSGKKEAQEKLDEIRGKTKEIENPEIHNRTLDEIERYIDEIPGYDKKIAALKNITSKILSNESLDKIGLDTKISEINRRLDNCQKIDSGKEFIEEIRKIFGPISVALEKNPAEAAEFERKAFNEFHNFTPINKIFSYKIDNGDLHLHMAPSKDVSAISKVRFINDALEKLISIVEKDKKIKEISATSWIVANNPKLLERFGFKNLGPISDKEREENFAGETNQINRAVIKRREFLNKYSKQNNSGLFRKIISTLRLRK